MKKTVFRRLLSVMLAILMVISLMLTTASAEGVVTEIGTYAELLEFAGKVNAGTDYTGQTISLTANINLNGSASSQWTPIGSTSANKFKGTFDGQNHVISGLYMNVTTSNQGFFGYVNGGTVKNLTIIGDITASASNVGGIAAQNEAGSLIENCHNAVNISITASFTNYFGGITSVNNGTINNSYNSGSISAVGSSAAVGGIAGQNTNAGAVNNCYNLGNINNGTGSHVGGIAGQQRFGTPSITNSYSLGNISGGSNIGGILGQWYVGAVTNNYYLAGSAAKGVGDDNATATVKAAADMQDAAFVTLLGSDFIPDTDLNNGYPIFPWQLLVDDGAAVAPPDVEISTYEELLEFAADVNAGDNHADKLVVLNENIDLGGIGQPWTAIGNFKGIFDGQNHVISGLYMNVTSGTKGFFSTLSGGTIKNLTIKGNITTSSGTVGGFAGSTTTGSTIENCHNDVNITVTTSGVHYFGGFAGSNYANVSNCYNSGNISIITSSAVGGFIGSSFSGNITNCYNLGTISGGSGSHISGIVGQLRGGAVSTSYNIGSITGSTNVGAIVGQKQSGTISDNYYLTGTASYGIGSTSDTTGVMPDTDMKAPAFVTTLGDAFIADTDINNGYPIFPWQLEVDNSIPFVFSEARNYSAEIAGYIRGAINRRKTAGSLSATDSLLSTFRETSTGNDWIAVTMAGYSTYDITGKRVYLYNDGTGYDDFCAALAADVTAKYAKNNGVLDTAKVTEWQRAILAIQAVGGNPLSFGTYNSNPINMVADGIYNYHNIGIQGINGVVYGLIALDTLLYETPVGATNSRDDIIRLILSQQAIDGVNGAEYGAWSLSSSSTDPDMGGMTIQALAPYYNSDTEYTYTNIFNSKTETKTVRQAIDEGLARLSTLQRNDGDFASWGTVNSESTAQVLCALAALGIDPQTDGRFIKNGNTLIDGLLKYRNSDGGFGHTNTSFDSMGNDQASYALAAYWRYLNGFRSLYDYRDKWDTVTRGKIDAAVSAIDAVGTANATDYKPAIRVALSVFSNVPENEKRYVYNYSELLLAIEGIGGEDELDTDTPFLMSIEITTPPDRTDYSKGETFDTTGMVVTAAYSDGGSEAITDYTFIPDGALSLGDKTVTISKGIRRASIPIVVSVWAGKGTQAEPFLISELSDLNNLLDEVNTGLMATEGVHFKMTADIDFSSQNTWAGIGNGSGKEFKGHFDGDNHVIKNITFTGNGFFGYLGGGAFIENFGIESGSRPSSSMRGGGIAGLITTPSDNSINIINCFNGANIPGSRTGGIIGDISVRGAIVINIERCYNKGNIGSGGIVGYRDIDGGSSATIGITNFVTIRDCYNIGTISAGGGIIGSIGSGITNIINCYNVGGISSGGGIADRFNKNTGGLDDPSNANNCYYLNTSASVGVVSPWPSSFTPDIRSMTASALKEPAFLTAIGSAFKADFAGNPTNNGYPILNWQTEKSSDKTLASVKIGLYTAELTGDGVYTALVPPDRVEAFVEIIPNNEKASASQPVAAPDFTQWAFTVTAEDGTTKDYVVNVTVLEDISSVTEVIIFEPIITGQMIRLEFDSTIEATYKVIASTYDSDKRMTKLVIMDDLVLSQARDAYDASFTPLEKPEGGSLKIIIMKNFDSISPVMKKAIVIE